MHIQFSDSLDFLAGLRDELPVVTAPVSLVECHAGLVIIDEQNGFATVGAGPLAPAEPNAQIATMIEETDRLSRIFINRDMPIAVFLDYHHPDRPEPPYPPHCIAGSGEEDLVPKLQWLANAPQATELRADCINDFVGSIDIASGRNQIVEWVSDHKLDTIIVVGICTDICVAEFVTTMLSARNHRMMPRLKDVVVYEPGCATYDLPKERVAALGLPKTAAHPQNLAHHLGLYLMASRGARLASQIYLNPRCGSSSTEH
jgi:nicotinamidase-related amidase